MFGSIFCLSWLDVGTQVGTQELLKTVPKRAQDPSKRYKKRFWAPRCPQDRFLMDLLLIVGRFLVVFFVANLGIQSAASGDSRHRAWPGLGNKMGCIIANSVQEVSWKSSCRHGVWPSALGPWQQIHGPILLPSPGQARWRESPLAALWIKLKTSSGALDCLNITSVSLLGCWFVPKQGP